MNECKCTISDGGWCERHHVKKSAHWVKLCRTHPKYDQAWEENRGPGQNLGDQPGVPAVVVLDGVGTELSRLLSKFWIVERPSCPCKDHAHVMNVWGPEVCREKLGIILGWLRKEAKKRHLPFSKRVTKWLVLLAIRRFEHRQRLETSGGSAPP